MRFSVICGLLLCASILALLHMRQIIGHLSPHHAMAREPVRKIAISCWSEPCRGVIGQPGAAILEDLGYAVTHINVRESSFQDLIDRLEDQDAILWWNWDLGKITPSEISLLRQALPKQQIWALFNWDDPHAWGDNAPMERREMISKLASQLDIVYTTGSSTIPKYLASGSKYANFVVVPYSDLFHYFDPDPNFACDVNFIATNYYDDFKGLSSSRRAIVEALAAAPDIDTAIYGLDSGNAETTDAFKGPIRFEDNHKVFSSCKLTLNLLVAAVGECSGGHMYANERVPTAMASGAVQLVENHACYSNGLLENGKTAVYLRSADPMKVVAQVREIINNYTEYQHIREAARLSAQKWRISRFIQTLVKDLQDQRSGGGKIHSRVT